MKYKFIKIINFFEILIAKIFWKKVIVEDYDDWFKAVLISYHFKWKIYVTKQYQEKLW